MNHSSVPEDSVQTEREKIRQHAPAAGCLLRLYWMLVGNAILGFCAYWSILGEDVFSGMDAVYWLAVASLVLVRYVDIQHFAGGTGEGQPATIRDWQRYSLGLVGVALAVWIAVHAVSHFGVWDAGPD